MKVKEYLSKIKRYEKVTFLVARARKYENENHYHPEYGTTPIRYVEEWEYGVMEDYIVLNHNQPPIDWLSGCPWVNWHKTGELRCLLVIAEEDFSKLYPSEEQRRHTEDFCERKIKEDLKW